MYKENNKIHEQQNFNLISENISKRITSLRFILIILVVFIHNCYTNNTIQTIINAGGTPPIFVENSFGSWIKLFISNGIARGAVPLFFLFSGFLQIKKNDDYRTILKKRIKSLVIPYIIWMTFYAFYFGGLKLIISIFSPSILQNPNDTLLNWSFIDWIHKILGYKMNLQGNFEFPEFANQFWFIRDLFILIVLSPFIKFLINKIPIGFFCILTIIYLLPTHVYFVETQALYFYTLGLYWGYYNLPLFETIDKMTLLENLILFMIIFLITYLCQNNGKGTTSYWFMCLSACMVLIKISSYLVFNEKIYTYCAYLAGYSFFLFAIHEPILNTFITKIWIKIFPMKNTFFSLLQYFIPTIITISVGTIIGIILKKILPRLFKILTGGR